MIDENMNKSREREIEREREPCPVIFRVWERCEKNEFRNLEK